MMDIKAIPAAIYLLLNTELSMHASSGTCMTNIWEVQKARLHAHSQMPISLWIEMRSIPLVQMFCISEVFQVSLVSAGSKGTWKTHGWEGLVIGGDRQGCIPATHSLPQQHLLLTLQNSKGRFKGPSLAQSSVCGTGYLKLEHKPSKPVGHRTRQEKDKELLFVICHIL